MSGEAARIHEVQTEEISRPLGLRERNKRDKLRRIKTAARALFVEKGYEAATTREVSRRARIGTGTLFLYVQDKQQLLFLIFQDDLREVEEKAFAPLPSGKGLIHDVMHVFELLFNQYEKETTLSKVFLKELLLAEGPVGVELTKLTLEFIGRIARLIEAGKERGEIRGDISSMTAAQNFFSSYYFALLAWLGGVGGGKDVQLNMLRSSIEMQISGLAPGAKRK